MNEHPILFSAEMVKAIFDGRKTQTRRVLKKQPLDVLPMNTPNKWIGLMQREPESKGTVFHCRYGIPGDKLWVRETWHHSNPVAKTEGLVSYRADGEFLDHFKKQGYKWKPSIFMPRWASRITLEVVSVRVERLQEISNEDALQEGVEIDLWDMALVARKYGTKGEWFQAWGNGDGYENYSSYETIYKDSFQTLWNSINAKRGFSWEQNPFVWVVEFRKI